MTKKSVHSSIPGPIVLFGSGETSPSGRKIFDAVMHQLPPLPRIALLETPAGFELNSPQVIGRVGDFIRQRLQNYQPQVTVIQARQRGTPFSPDNPRVVAPMLESDMVFMGPGSPSYAVRQLRNSLAWQVLQARHRLGAAIVLASAATVAVSTYALPVYEIYKVGEDLHWKDGLDLFGAFGLPLVFIPHWNNNDGGEELDTSRCFMGQPRFARLMEMLPPELTVLGIDEKTALFMDIELGTCRVVGLGGVTLLHTGDSHAGLLSSVELQASGLAEVADQRGAHVHQYRDGESFPLSECCPFDIPSPGAGLPVEVWRAAVAAQRRLEEQRQPKPQAVDAPPPEVLALVEERQSARLRKDWPASDVLRRRISELGWQVLDTPEGPRVERGG